MSVAFERFDETPTTKGMLIATVPAVVAVLLVATFPLALLVGAIGAVAIVGGVRRGSRTIVTVGTIALFGAALLAGIQGAAIVQTTASAAAAIVAWDAGINAIGIARQLGAAADSTRLLAVHTLVTAGVAVAIGVAAITTYWLGSGGRPTAAVALLLLAALLFVVILDR